MKVEVYSPTEGGGSGAPTSRGGGDGGPWPFVRRVVRSHLSAESRSCAGCARSCTRDGPLYSNPASGYATPRFVAVCEARREIPSLRRVTELRRLCPELHTRWATSFKSGERLVRNSAVVRGRFERRVARSHLAYSAAAHATEPSSPALSRLRLGTFMHFFLFPVVRTKKKNPLFS